MGLQDLAGKEHGFGTPELNMSAKYQDWSAESHGLKHQIEHAYRVSGRGCRISRVRNIRSYMPTRYQGGLGTTDRTCLLRIRRRLQDLTGSKHQIEPAY